MIRYALKCENGHGFESWFRSARDFEALRESGQVVCVSCGSTRVKKAVMAPQVHSSNDKSQAAPATGSTPADAPRPLSQPASPAERALRALRSKLEASGEYVGRNFADEARRIHAGDAPRRPIWGEARRAEARALIEEGVPVTPLPWVATRETN